MPARLFRLLALGFCAAFAGGADLAAQEQTPEFLVREAIRTQRTGDFEAAWQSLVEFYGHPYRNNLELDDFAECFLFTGCPSIGSLGAFLGKSKVEAGDLASFCPHWRRFIPIWESSDDPQFVAGIPERIDLIRTSGLGGSCERWFDRQIAVLHAEPIPQPPPTPQVAPIAYKPHPPGKWPTVEISIDGHAAWALADSGASTTSLHNDDPRLRAFLADGDILDVIEVVTGNGIRPHETVRVSNLGIGGENFSQIIINRAIVDGHLDVGYVLGMNVLLKYPAVCYHWTEAKLYLGEIGPCNGGLSPGNARLLGNSIIVLELPIHQRSKLDVLLDTGGLVTSCSREFIDSNGARRFLFGDDPQLATECASEDEFWSAVRGQFQAVIGMDTFLRFDAFGWELNPLKVYFVPRDRDG